MTDEKIKFMKAAIKEADKAEKKEEVLRYRKRR